MSDFKNPFEAFMKQAQDMAKSMNPALENFSMKGLEDAMPTLPKEFMEFIFGNTMNPNGLDAKTKLLLTLAGLTVQGAQADSQIRLTVRHAKEAGASNQEIIETIGMMSMFGGVPAMTRAADLAREVLTNNEEPQK